ncbi:hypothetical protein NESM_000467300 [Novymonas esmeraldas]|uniref:Uncharacterized protein n=1 Tax=Novymonas esmeraldas TaxID=1808958 RepID=A0AAW0EMJ8_9TRYP
MRTQTAEMSRRHEDATGRGVSRQHVWKSRASDLTVINLRDVSEVLSSSQPPTVANTTAAAAAVELKRTRAVSPPPTAQAPPPPPPQVPAPASRSMTGKQESLHALLAKLQLGRAAPEQSSPPTTATSRPPPPPPPAAAKPLPPAQPPQPSQPPQPPANTASSAVTVPAPSAPAPVPAVRTPSPAAAPSPATAILEASDRPFPDPKESSSGPAGQFEFLAGINIPGQGGPKKAEAEAASLSSSMALFHDPLWGGGASDAFAMLPPLSKASPKPPLRSVFSELYASVAPSTASTLAPTPAATVASPPAATVGVSPVPTTTTTPSIVPVMGGMVQPTPTPTPTSTPQLPLPLSPPPLPLSQPPLPLPLPPPQQQQQQQGIPFPLYGVPIPFMAQQPQFPAGMLYGTPNFFPYGAAPMMMAPSQPLQQGYVLSASSMMRPGTNVKAMPFVPGSTT